MNMNINIECWSILILFWFYNFMIYFFIIDIWDFFWFLRSSPPPPNKCSCKELRHSGMNVKKSVWNLELAQVCLLFLLLLFLRYACSLLIHLCLPSFGRCTLEADLQMNCKLRMLDLKTGPKSTSQLWRNESGFFYPLLSESLHQLCMQQGKVIFEGVSSGSWFLLAIIHCSFLSPRFLLACSDKTPASSWRIEFPITCEGSSTVFVRHDASEEPAK